MRIIFSSLITGGSVALGLAPVTSNFASAQSAWSKLAPSLLPLVSISMILQKPESLALVYMKTSSLMHSWNVLQMLRELLMVTNYFLPVAAPEGLS